MLLSCLTQHNIHSKSNLQTCLKENGAGPTARLNKYRCRIDVRRGISALTTSSLCQWRNNRDIQLGQCCHRSTIAKHYCRSVWFYLFSVNIAYQLHKVLSNLGANLLWSEPNNPTIKPAVGGHDLLLEWLLVDLLFELVFLCLIICFSSLLSSLLFSSLALTMWLPCPTSWVKPDKVIRECP